MQLISLLLIPLYDTARRQESGKPRRHYHPIFKFNKVNRAEQNFKFLMLDVIPGMVSRRGEISILFGFPIVLVIFPVEC